MDQLLLLCHVRGCHADSAAYVAMFASVVRLSGGGRGEANGTSPRWCLAGGVCQGNFILGKNGDVGPL